MSDEHEGDPADLLRDYLDLVDRFVEAAYPPEVIELELSLLRWDAHGPDESMPAPWES